MEAPLRLGIVGCGGILNAHLNGLKALWDHGQRDFRIVALCDRNLAAAARHRQRESDPTLAPPAAAATPHLCVSDLHDDLLPDLYDDWRTLLATARLDGLVVLTPTPSPDTNGLAPLAAGRHRVIEKPLALTVARARRLCEAAAAADKRLAVAEIARFGELIRMGRWCLDHGAIGVPKLLYELVHGLVWSPAWARSDTAWRHRRASAGAGFALDRGVHLLHAMEYLGGPLESISGQCAILESWREVRPTGQRVACDVDDTFTADLRFASGALGQLGGSAALRGAQTRVPLTVHGSLATLREGWLSWTGGQQAVAERYRLGATPAEQVALFGPQVHNPFGLQISRWLDSIRSGCPSEIEGPVGLRDVALAWCLLESAAEGGTRLPVSAVLAGEIRTAQDAAEQALATD